MSKRLVISLLISVLGHLVLLLVLLLNFEFSVIETSKEKSAPNIMATAVDGAQIKKEILRRENAVKKQQQDQLKKQRDAAARKEQDRLDKIALDKKRKQQQKEAQEAEQKKKQDRLDRLNKEKEIAEQKKRDQDAKAKRDAELKAQRDREEKLMAEQMAAEQAAMAANRAAVMSEAEIYRSRIESKIRQFWNKPEREGYCLFNLRLGPGGILIGWSPLEESGRYCESAEKAIKLAAPFPMSRDPDVIAELRNLNIVLGKRN